MAKNFGSGQPTRTELGKIDRYCFANNALDPFSQGMVHKSEILISPEWIFINPWEDVERNVFV